MAGFLRGDPRVWRWVRDEKAVVSRESRLGNSAASEVGDRCPAGSAWRIPSRIPDGGRLDRLPRMPACLLADPSGNATGPEPGLAGLRAKSRWSNRRPDSVALYVLPCSLFLSLFPVPAVSPQ